MYKILIVDDEQDYLNLLKEMLELEAYTVLTAVNGTQAITQAAQQPALILLDIMLPDISGYEVCKQIRQQVSCPIIFLSAKQNEADRIYGLAIGGDDYLVKPFSLAELKIKIMSHLRREQRALTDSNVVLRYHNMQLDLTAKKISLNNNLIVLTKREFAIIELLALHPNRTYSKEQIYQLIWDYDAYGDANTVTERIKNIRAKFAKYDAIEYIVTVWGIGYQWLRNK